MNFRFLKHFVVMSVVMLFGAIAGRAIVDAVLGLTVNQALHHSPVQFVIVTMMSMIVAMVTWMRSRRQGWRSCLEMSVAMALPAIPFIGLYWANVIPAASCLLYCGASLLAMLALMLFRRAEYSM